MKNPEIWEKNLIALGISQFIYRAGSRSLIPFLPLFIHDLGRTDFGDTALWSGWIFAAPFIVSFFTTPLWGGFGDRFGRKLMTLISVFGFAVSQLLMGISGSLLQLLIFASLQEAMGGFYPAAISLTASNTPKEKSAHALGVIQFSNSAGNVVGPLIGGILADLFGFREVFRLVGISSVLAGLIVMIFVREKHLTVNERSYHSVTGNLDYLFRNKALLSCGLFLLIYSVSVSLLRPTFSLFIASFNFSQLTSTVTGILLGIYGGSSAAASLLFGRLSGKFNLRSLFIYTISAASVSSVLIAYSSSIVMLSALLLISGFSLGIILPLVYTFITEHTADERKAGVFGIGSSFQITGNLAGSALSGIIVINWGVGIPFIAAGIFFLIVIPISILGLKIKNP